ncbi:MAG: FtsW/RodA/SpoVE family cell cycle protein [Coriobacteriia bacterium]|nr:FtsW/RodA/SpoVE family cell cycle protein [Coriobacteriia bacterium]
MGTRRNTELLLLFAAALPVLLFFAIVGTQAGGDFSWEYLAVPAALFLAFGLTHVVLRFRAPGADPVLLPVAFVLSGTGLAMLTRLAPDEVMWQVTLLFIAVAVMVFFLFAVPKLERLADYKYTMFLGCIILQVLPFIPGLGRTYHGATRWISIPGINFSFQPGEIAQILLILFLAGYLAENRELLSISTRRIFGVIPFPEPRTLMPLIIMWAISFVIMVFQRDLGASLLFFSVFLAMVYAATGRFVYVATGLGLFGAGAYFAYSTFSHVQIRVANWIDPFANPAAEGFQLIQSLFAFAAGGLFGLGPGGGLPHRIPLVEDDFIFAAIGEELGLLGAAIIIICFLILIYRGLSIASRAKSDMAAFTAVGIVASLGFQVFVIIGGVTRLIPMTGVTLPFISRGGTSLLAVFILLALLLRAGDETTGINSEMKSTGGLMSVLGRVALGKRLTVLAVFFSALMLVLIGNLTWLQVVNARYSNNHPLNTRNLMMEARNPRGAIVTADGVVLANSMPVSPEEGSGRAVTYRRIYPEGSLAAHLVGYHSEQYGRAGIEAAANDALTGQRSFGSWNDVFDAALGNPVPGNDVVLTLDSHVQRAAQNALGNNRGAIVALNPQTGALLASASTPTYDPNSVTELWESLQSDETAPLLDRSRQSLSAPGSTFKVVTLAAAYEHSVANPQTVYPAPGAMDIGNAPVTNFERSNFASTNVQNAMAWSINTVFGQLAVDVGAEDLVQQSEDFGFNQRIPFELHVNSSLMPHPENMTTWELAWAGIGQPVGEHDDDNPGPQTNAFQMALVAAGIANDGVVMRPYVIDHVVSASGQRSILSQTRPTEFSRAMSAETAQLVADSMIQTTNAGTGGRAAIPGVQVAGKTGTAEVGTDRPSNAWYIGFAPAENPTVAVAVMVEGAGQGGRSAAPAARQVMETALQAQD